MINKIYVLFPVFNEGKSIYNLLKNFNEVLEKAFKIPHELVIVNDRSTDNSAGQIQAAQKEFSNLNISVINHTENKGLARAMCTGFKNIGGKLGEYDIIVTMDGDNTHNPHLIKEMMSKINQGADIVIASRYLEQSRVYGLSKLREFLSWGAGCLYALRWKIRGVKDYTCGFRAYKAWVVKSWMSEYKEKFIEETGFTVTAETLIKMNRFSPVIAEVPMILKYSNKLEPSNMNVFKTIMMTLGILWRNKL